MKKIAIALISVVFLCLMGGCDGAPAENVDIDKAVNDLREQIAYQDELSQLTDKMFDSVYQIDRSLVKKAVAYTSSGATAEEIVAIEMNSAEDVKTAETALKDRLQYQKDGYSDYGPEEVPKIDNAVIKSSGCYIFMSVSNDHGKAAEIIGSYLG